MSFYISLSLHVIFFTMWMGGLLILIKGLKSNPRPIEFLQVIKRFYVEIGMGGAIATGIYQIYFHGMKFYMTQGWFHGKLTAVILLFIATVLANMELSRSAKAGTPSPKWFAPVVHSLVGIGFLAAVVCVILGRAGKLQ